MDKCGNCNKKIHIPNWKRKSYSGRKPNKHFFCNIVCHRNWWIRTVSKKFKGKGNVRWSGGLQLKHCLTCKKDFFIQKYRENKAKFCSHRCRAKWAFTGKRNPKWNGGVSRDQRDILPEYRNWRSEVYKRDGWECKICKFKGRMIVAHHIKIWKTFPKLRFKVNNGITLCRRCHCRLHTLNKKTIDFMFSLPF